MRPAPSSHCRLRRARARGTATTPLKRPPSLAALPRHRRHPRRGVPPRPRAHAVLLPGVTFSSRIVLPRRRRHAPSAPRWSPPLPAMTASSPASSALGSILRYPPRRAFLIPAKRLAAFTARRALRHSPADSGATLLAGEGIETVLSLITAVPNITAAAALSAGSLCAFAPPSGIASLVIARDNDGEGERAAERLARRCAQIGVHAAVIVPELGDFNDDLTAFGASALAARVAPLFSGSTKIPAPSKKE